MGYEPIPDAEKAAIIAQLDRARESLDDALRHFANVNHPEYFSDIDLSVMREAERLVRGGHLLPDTAADHFDRIAKKIERNIEKHRAEQGSAAT